MIKTIGIVFRNWGKLFMVHRKEAVTFGKAELSIQSIQMVMQARQEAIGLGHSHVGSEHLLLALLQSKCLAAQVLHRHGWDAKALRRLMHRGTSGLLLVQGVSDEAEKPLALAGEEMRRLGSSLVQPEHLLLGILRAPSCTASRLLTANGTSLDCLFSDLYWSLTEGKNCQQERGNDMRLLEQFCDDMVARASSMDPVIGRETEIETVISILSRKNKNNPALIGEPGVGKTAIVEGLAQRMARNQVPEGLQSKRLLNLNMASVLAGTKYRGEFEERIRDILAEVRRCGNIILFVDEMHTIVGAGSAEGAIDAANLLKPALGRGELQMIGATTLEEYRKHIEKDAALERRFRPVTVREPSRADTLAMLEGLRPGLEQHHQIHITKEAMEAAVDLSTRYLTDHFLPDKAVDLLDESAAALRSRSRREHGLEQKRSALSKELKTAVEEDRFEQAATLRDQLQRLVQQQRGFFGRLTLEREDVAAAVAHRTGIPVGKVNQTDRQRLLHLKEELQQQVLGQEEAAELVASAVCRGRLGLADSNRPVASLLFLGPTGVGKTALCKALAESVFGSQDAMVRLDMSEYMEQHAVSRLLGAPPGYVGHGEGGELTEPVRRRPYCVVLLDELEKAHRDVTSVLLQVMEDGILTDSTGRHINFRNTILVMTSNLGSEDHSMEQVGFLGQGKTTTVGQKALQAYFSPEFLGRLDGIAVFHSLSQPVLEAIAKKELSAASRRARGAGVELQTDEEAAHWLARQCAGGKGGARDLRRAIRREIETPLARKLLTAEGPISLKTAVEREQLLLLES